MSGIVHRRALMIGAAAAASTSGLTLAGPALARSRDEVSDYYDRLRTRLGDAGGGRFLTLTEDQLLGTHNELRREHALTGLARHGALDQAARAHASDMLERGYFEHASPEGFSSVERVGLLARRFVGLAGENIVDVRGGPASSSAELTQLWRDSPGHRANMLRTSFTHVGFGVVRKGERTVAAAAFGQRFVELSAPMAFRIEAFEGVGALLDAGSPVQGFALEPVGGGRQLGPFWAGDPLPSLAMTGPFAIKPYLPDLTVRGRYIVVDGPIIDAAA